MAFGVDRDHTELEFVAHASYLVYVLHWLRGELADVSKTVNVWIEFHEQSEWIDLEDATFDPLAEGVLLRHVLPRIIDELLHGQEDFGTFNVDDFGADVITYLEDIARVIDALPSDFGDVYQAFEVFVEADKGTEVGDRRDGAFHAFADLVFGEDGFLLGFPDGLFGDDDFFFVFVDVEDFDFKLLADQLLELLLDLGFLTTSHTWVVVWGELGDWHERRNVFHAGNTAAFVGIEDFDLDDCALCKEFLDLVPCAFAASAFEGKFEFAEFVVEFDDSGFDFVADAEVEVLIEFWTADETDGDPAQVTTDFVAADGDHDTFDDVTDFWKGEGTFLRLQ